MPGWLGWLGRSDVQFAVAALVYGLVWYVAGTRGRVYHAASGTGRAFCNLPFRYGWRVRRWFFWHLFRLEMCPQCGTMVDLSRHPSTRCPGHQKDTLREIDAALFNHGRQMAKSADDINGLCVRVDAYRKATADHEERLEAAKLNWDVWKRIVQDLTTRHVALEGQVKGFDKRLGKVHQRINCVVGHTDLIRSEEFISLDTKMEQHKDVVNRTFAEHASKHNALAKQTDAILTRHDESLRDGNIPALLGEYQRLQRLMTDLLAWKEQMDEWGRKATKWGEETDRILNALADKTVAQTDVIKAVSEDTKELKSKVNLIIPDVVQ